MVYQWLVQMSNFGSRFSDNREIDARFLFQVELLASPKAALAKYFDMDLPENFSLNVVEY